MLKVGGWGRGLLLLSYNTVPCSIYTEEIPDQINAVSKGVTQHTQRRAAQQSDG